METYFETKLDWECETKGWLTAKGPGPFEITVSSKEHPGMWSPEHLFVSSINASFMEKFLSECETSGIPLINYSSTAIGIRKISEGHKMITEIIVEPQILVLNGTDFNKVIKVIQNAESASVACNSVKTKINIQPKIIFKMLEEIA
jgi:organic hydroperoxide reductase OsmC/OhrA